MTNDGGVHGFGSGNAMVRRRFLQRGRREDREGSEELLEERPRGFGKGGSGDGSSGLAVPEEKGGAVGEDEYDGWARDGSGREAEGCGAYFLGWWLWAGPVGLLLSFFYSDSFSYFLFSCFVL
jgi:hypothetical protein